MVASGIVDALLARSRAGDGGFGSVPGADPEPAATALAAIALSDEGAVDWLLKAQRPDGSFGIDAGGVVSDDTALTCLALPEGPALQRGLDHVESTSGANAVDGPGAPPYGWSWTIGAHGWTEPTAWGVLALRQRRPTATDRIHDGLAALQARACVGGGWNYGTPESFAVEQPPFVQTTAIALLATVGIDAALTASGQRALHERWRDEESGFLSLATAAATLRVLHDTDAGEAVALVEHNANAAAGLGTIALAWASVALGDGLHALDAS
jgi:Prenyltransferase and squalene oxidase repeat